MKLTMIPVMMLILIGIAAFLALVGWFVVRCIQGKWTSALIFSILAVILAVAGKSYLSTIELAEERRRTAVVESIDQARHNFVVREAPSISWAYPPNNEQPTSASSHLSEARTMAREPNDGDASKLPMDVLWDQITKSRIDLDDESVTETSDEPENNGTSIEVKTQSSAPPDWVTTPPKPIGNVYRQVLTSDPFVTKAECQRQLEMKLLDAVARRVEQLAASEVGYEVEVRNPVQFGVGLDFILREICREEYTATVDSWVGEMQQVHLLLEFDQATDKRLRTAWIESERNARIETVVKSLFFALTGLAVIYGVLQFDTWSRGYYSKQLLAGVLAAIILVVTLLVW